MVARVGCRRPLRPGGAGFSLIEVSLALLLIGTSMIALLALFPKGMAQGELAMNDTQAAMFARYVFAGMRAQAESLTWAEWCDDALRRDALLNVDLPGGVKLAASGDVAFPDENVTPPKKPRKIYYNVNYMDYVPDEVTGAVITNLVRVGLKLSTTADSGYSWNYYTEICYAALPQG